ncbi:serine hydrolase domain-containing protein [Streptomyces sp. NPDC091212]|uniref:serine hydrolase domain-containing protein n=1 Tax=Streptomyces sp. NPDC091212 TaxID=3155191 RepID=UPI00342AEF3F
MAARTGTARTGTARTAALVGLVVAALAGTALVTPAVAAQAPEAGGAGHSASAGHQATGKALDALVAEGVPGVTAQVEDRKGTWRATAGVADRTTGRERGAQDRYRVGSITKTFVATVLLQLEAERRLDLDATVDSYLPGVVRGHGNDGRRITVRQLLNHTSGIYNYTSDPGFVDQVFGDGFFEHRYDTWTPRQLVALATAHAPDFEPGTGWNYSNTNYILAGMIVEKVTGRTYGNEIERRILRPLGLRATSVPTTDPAMPRPAGRAYSKLGVDSATAPIHDVTELNPSAAGSAGAMISNPADLNRFYGALLKGALLPDKQLKEMMTTVPLGDGTPPGFSYGLGLSKDTLSCGTVVWGHNGGIHGSSSSSSVTGDGKHALSMNLNGDWTGDARSTVEAEFCG